MGSFFILINGRYENLKQQASDAMHELLETAYLQKSAVFVAECPAYEAGGYKIRYFSNPKAWSMENNCVLCNVLLQGARLLIQRSTNKSTYHFRQHLLLTKQKDSFNQGTNDCMDSFRYQPIADAFSNVVT